MNYENYYSIILTALTSFICTLAGIHYLSPYRIRHPEDIEYVLSISFNTLTAGTSTSFLLFAIICVTLFGIIFSVSLLYNYLRSIHSDAPMSETIALCSVCALLIIDILISIYLLLFVILLLLFFSLITYALITVLSNERGKGGSVRVRGHFRKGIYVRSHTRKRPNRF